MLITKADSARASDNYLTVIFQKKSGYFDAQSQSATTETRQSTLLLIFQFKQPNSCKQNYTGTHRCARVRWRETSTGNGICLGCLTIRPCFQLLLKTLVRHKVWLCKVPGSTVEAVYIQYTHCTSVKNSLLAFINLFIIVSNSYYRPCSDLIVNPATA